MTMFSLVIAKFIILTFIEDLTVIKIGNIEGYGTQ